MKRALPWRKPPSDEPTSEQLRAAENAAFSAMRRGNAVLVKKTCFKERMRMMDDDERAEVVHENDSGSTLKQTSVEDFLSNFRINGLECMATVYE